MFDNDLDASFLSAARNRSIRWARDLLASGNFVILDTETTGLHNADEVIQLAVIDSAGKVLLNELLNPKISIDPGAQAVHHISKAMLADKPEFKSISDRLISALAGKTIVTYSADFDRRILRQTARTHGVDLDPVIGQTWACAMLSYAAYYGDYNEHRGSFRWQNLTGGDHSALGDCLATLDLIRRMAAGQLTGEEQKQDVG